MAAGSVSAPLIIPIFHLQTHRPKNHIDSSTPVSIQSGTAGVQIFFTLDGSKPAVAQRGPAGGSRKYSEPIVLPAGRVAVRAVAVTSDGRESSTVTKEFVVDQLPASNGKENDNFLQRDKQNMSEGLRCSAENSNGSSLKAPELRMMGNASHQSGRRSLNARLVPPATGTRAGASQRSQFARSSVSSHLNSTHKSRINREMGFLRCPQCLSHRPSDPLSRFCPQCGAALPVIPQQRLLPAEGGQAVCCGFCNAVVPVNTKSCLICETSIQQQRQTKEHVLCVCCGSGNPTYVTSCLTCESPLQPVLCMGDSAPSVPSSMSSCSVCRRRIQSDARFCDWCGSKPSRAAASCVICWRCGATGHPYALYCAACSVFLEAPTPPACSSVVTQPNGGATATQAGHLPDSAPKPESTTPTAEQYTQTVGLYYPSATHLRRREEEKTQHLSRQQPTRSHQPLTAISPGRGYWRKQLDHVCAHLRSYTQNNAPFRALLGEPRMGRMVAAVMQEDRYEVSLTISFVMAGQEKRQVEAAGGGGAAVSGAETLSSVTERAALGSDLASLCEIRPAKTTTNTKPPVKDAELVKELGPGRGQVTIIQELLDQGADPSCCDSDGRHTLATAVLNGHHDALPVLVQRGADINRQSGRMKNSALHEAAALGSEGLQSARILLSCKARVASRNAGGQTAYDLALDSGCDHMVELLAAQAGLDLLGKPRVSLELF
ncbi:double zinc ribbon and ankyrin repeat-containing protein 1 [Nelusetta ayraudi]|uniref:double zinc ribbon and ankyrin repeat-containing protein 1 n=1 Tax=Nelusetta ayraudi TaxID=303726 RepID=UPI003F720A69